MILTHGGHNGKSTGQRINSITARPHWRRGRNAGSDQPAEDLSREIISKTGGFVMAHLILGHGVSGCFSKTEV